MTEKSAITESESYAAAIRRQVVRPKSYTQVADVKDLSPIELTPYVVSFAAAAHRLYQQLLKRGCAADQPFEFRRAEGCAWCIPYKTYEVLTLQTAREGYLLLMHPDMLNHHVMSAYRFYRPVDAGALASTFHSVDRIWAAQGHIQEYYSDEAFVQEPTRPTLDRVWRDFLTDEYETKPRPYPAVVQYQLGVRPVTQPYTQDLETLFGLLGFLAKELAAD